MTRALYLGVHNVMGGGAETEKGSILFRPPVFFMTPVIIYMLLYRTLLSKKIARAPGGHKRFMLTKLGGGGIYSKTVGGDLFKNRIDSGKDLI